jgi:hypothetical protein
LSPLTPDKIEPSTQTGVLTKASNALQWLTPQLVNAAGGAGSLAKARSSQAAEVFGRYATPLGYVEDAGAVLSGLQQDGGKPGIHTAEAVGNVVGGTVGVAGGAVMGAALGLPVDGVGAIPVALVGGAVGGYVGAEGGQQVVDTTATAIHDIAGWF